VPARIITLATRAIFDTCLNMGYLAESLIWCKKADEALVMAGFP
jgi:hypothetical protein